MLERVLEQLGRDIYASALLTPAGRELVTVATFIAMQGVKSQFEGHKECAVQMGNTAEQVEALWQKTGSIIGS